MTRAIRISSAALIFFAASLAASLAAIPVGERAGGQEAEWPGWRGPSANGLAHASATPPLRWSEEQNLRWKVALPGLGNSSPVVRGERLYLTTAIDTEGLEPGQVAGPQPGAPRADHLYQFVVLAIERASGAIAWQRVVHEGEPHEAEHSTGSHASASLNCAGERLLAFFGSRGLYCLDLEGRILWSKQLGRMTTLVGFGEGSTPALHGDTLVVQWDEEGPSFVAAFDVRDGKELWRQPREGDSSWGSPVIAEVEGRAQVILSGSDATRAYDLADGHPVWWCGGMSKNPVNSPLVVDGLVYVMNSYKGNVIQAIRLSQAEGEVVADAGLAWSLHRDAAYVPTPVVSAGGLYYLRDSTGVLNCVDAATGAERFFAKRLGDIQRVHASPVVAGGQLYVTSREGLTVVLPAQGEFEILATNTLEDVFDASPAFVAGEIYLRGRSHLYCIAAQPE